MTTPSDKSPRYQALTGLAALRGQRLVVNGVDFNIELNDRIPVLRTDEVPFNNDEVTALKVLNYLGRPVVSNEEILLMSNSEIIELYYSLRTIQGKKGLVVPHPVVSNGLGVNCYTSYEEDIQKRIYILRADLHSIEVEGKPYRVLVDPSMLNPPKKKSGTLGIVLTVLSFVPVIGLAATAANAALTVKGALDAKKLANKYGALGAEIGIGVAAAKMLPNPSYTRATLDSLKSKYLEWKKAYDTLSPHFEYLYRRVDTINSIDRALGSNMIVGNGEQPFTSKLVEGKIGYKFFYGISSPHWQLGDFFYSDRVRAIVIGGPINNDDLVAAGIGIGALALLLL